MEQPRRRALGSQTRLSAPGARRYTFDMAASTSTQPPWHGILAIERGGRPVIRGMRITAGDVLGWLASGMSHAEILEDFPELTEADIRAVPSYAAERERVTVAE